MAHKQFEYFLFQVTFAENICLIMLKDISYFNSTMVSVDS